MSARILIGVITGCDDAYTQTISYIMAKILDKVKAMGHPKTKKDKEIVHNAHVVMAGGTDQLKCLENWRLPFRPSRLPTSRTTTTKSPTVRQSASVCAHA